MNYATYMIGALCAVLIAPPAFAQDGTMDHMDHSSHAMPEVPRQRDKPLRTFRDPDTPLTRNGYLLDQNKNQVRMSDYRGKVVLLDFIFTTCRSGHCVMLNNKMRYIGKKMKEHLGKDLQFVTITFDPEADTPDVLKDYAESWESDPARWAFLTGATGDIMEITTKYNVFHQWNAQEDQFIHNMITVLLDREGETFATYSGAEYKLQHVIDDINKALKKK